MNELCQTFCKVDCLHETLSRMLL